MNTRIRTRLLAASITALLAACAAGPDYRQPGTASAPAFKEQGDWQPSEPADALSRGPWWRIFNDPVLDDLEERVAISNQNLKAAEAAYAQARALAAQSRAAYWPAINATAARKRSVIKDAPPVTTDSVGASASWEVDLWGGIRRSAESGNASAQASAAALAGAHLSIQATLATNYFALRAQDELQGLLDATVAHQQQALQITQNRYQAGVAARADVVTAQAQLLASQGRQLNNGIARAQLEHSIAVLCGEVPADFALAVAPLRTDVPTVPAGLPSTLLQRRPDIAEAERKVAAANATRGAARAAYFPNLVLAASTDYASSAAGQLLTVANRVWAVGPTLALSVFDGGLRRAQSAQARAAYEASVDNYRQTVLSAFAQVEDNLAAARILEQQAVVETASVAAAREAERLTLNQYQAGTVPYSSVIAAQTATFTAEQSALGVRLSRLSTSIAMIAAIGGGWDSAQLR